MNIIWNKNARDNWKFEKYLGRGMKGIVFSINYMGEKFVMKITKHTSAEWKCSSYIYNNLSNYIKENIIQPIDKWKVDDEDEAYNLFKKMEHFMTTNEIYDCYEKKNFTKYSLRPFNYNQYTLQVYDKICDYSLYQKFGDSKCNKYNKIAIPQTKDREKEYKEILFQITVVLIYLKAKKISHGDLTVQNVLLIKNTEKKKLEYRIRYGEKITTYVLIPKYIAIVMDFEYCTYSEVKEIDYDFIRLKFVLFYFFDRIQKKERLIDIIESSFFNDVVSIK